MRAVSRRAALGAAVVAGGLLLAGCGKPATESAESAPAPSVTAEDDAFHGTLMEPARPRPDLALPTTGGELFDLGDRPADEVTVLFFGYTHCPDLCPTTMADLALARDMLPAEVRDRVQVVFVTEDPGRDTPQLLREWLDRSPTATVTPASSSSKSARLTSTTRSWRCSGSSSTSTTGTFLPVQ